MATEKRIMMFEKTDITNDCTYLEHHVILRGREDLKRRSK